MRKASGAFDIPVSEWIIGAILAMQRGLLRGARRADEGQMDPFVKNELARQRVLIVGYGAIGAALANRLRPFGVEIVGIARSARSGTLGMYDLDAVLPAATIVVNLLRYTTETTDYFDKSGLGLLRDRALFVNAGRGRTLNTSALLSELARGRLRAALDVTDPEPLPDGHPLWSLPNVFVSPHAAGDTAASMRRAFES